MIELITIENESLSSLMEEYDKVLSVFIGPPYNAQHIYSYPIYLSRLLKAIDKAQLQELKERITHNRELEKKLEQQGYDESVLQKNHPKHVLKRIAELLIGDNTKTKKLFELLSQNSKNGLKTLVIANNDDTDFIYETADEIELNNFSTTRYSQIDQFFKNADPNDYFTLDYSLDGFNDFLRYHDYDFTINLILYRQEREVFDCYSKKYQKELEEELTSPTREAFTGIKYPVIPAKDEGKTLSKAIQSIVDNTENHWDEDDFVSIKENPGLNTPEKILYYVFYEGESFCDEMDSNEYVFDQKDRPLRIGQVQQGDKIRVYLERFNADLYEIAADEDPETFTLIEYYSNLWRNALVNQYRSNGMSIDVLHSRLKDLGLSVQIPTLRNYLDGTIKFPKRLGDLKAISELTSSERLNSQMQDLLKYKRIYNGVMIALGRNLKEEIRLYLQTKKLGSILKDKFTEETVENFIETKMPLMTVKEIKTRIITESE
ncbi:MAG: hypothetical protein ACE5H1_10900 [Thermodesulfobacteriota bacterium]